MTNSEQIEIDEYGRRWRDADKFLETDFYLDADVAVSDIEKIPDWELVFLQFYVWMGMDDRFVEFSIFDGLDFNYYRVYFYHFNTHESIVPEDEWLKKIIKRFKWLEDYNVDRWYNYEKGENLNNFKFVGLWFWNFLLVNKKYFDGYELLVKKLSKKYNLRESYFWLCMKTVSKIYHSDDKEEFFKL